MAFSSKGLYGCLYLKPRSNPTKRYTEANMSDIATRPARGHPNVQPWRELYTAALFETDRDRIPTRIAEAEKAIIARSRELFSAGSDTIEEDQALDDALYALKALQSCFEVHSAAA
jgi:hypothetical protein